ncbi:hypothetical protein BH24ACT3_BH24ACT3_04010 [soil metagenome]
MDGAIPVDTPLGSDVLRSDALASAALILARRFAAGSTMWCLAPGAPEHARHLAVEFVHPVIVGKRALPAVSIVGPDPVAALRAVVRPGDILLSVGAGDDSVTLDALRRSPAWGLTTVWVGWGDDEPAAATVAADARLWTTDQDGSARFDGRLVLTYHLPWELTHVCFEHPGLLKDPEQAGAGDVCITCSDEGRLAEVIQVDEGPDAVVRTARGIEHVDVSLVGELRRDDLVLVHAGTALSVVGATG